MADICYVCTGSCGGLVTEEEHRAGKTTCGDPACEKHGQPLEKRMYCPDCQVAFKEEEGHTCN